MEVEIEVGVGVEIEVEIILLHRRYLWTKVEKKERTNIVIKNQNAEKHVKTINVKLNFI